MCVFAFVTGGKGSPERLMQDGQGRRWSLCKDIKQMLSEFIVFKSLWVVEHAKMISNA